MLSGDRQKSPFDIQVTKDFPKIRQKPDVENPLETSAESASATSAEKTILPSRLVTKIYSKLHDNENSQVSMLTNQGIIDSSYNSLVKSRKYRL